MSTYIIAEAGVNHGGKLSIAKQLASAAKEAGADAVKIQTFSAARVASLDAPKAIYQLRTTDPGETQLDMLQRLEFPTTEYPPLLDHCKELGIEFLSTPYNEEDVDFLVSIGVQKLKLASISIAEPHFVKYAASTGLPLILSTGMSTMAEIDTAIHSAYSVGNTDIVLLQCTTNYPSLIEDTNLRAMITIRDGFRAKVGYSDHTQSDTACISAVALGADVIEKHLTLDKSASGPDHSCSYEPHEFTTLVRNIREAEICLGSAIKSPTQAELLNMPGMRRSLVARSYLPKGKILEESDITLRRPMNGLRPSLINELIGKPLRVPLEEGQLINWEHLDFES